MANWFQKLTKKQHGSAGAVHLLNPHQFEQRATRKLKKLLPEGYVAVVFDVDRFAELKSRYGTVRSDQLLAQVTDCLVAEQGGKRLLTHLQGDKFLLLGEYEADFMQKLQDELERAVSNIGLEKYVGVIRFSFGVYQVFSAEESVQAIIEKVRVAHKKAATNPYKAVVWYDTALVQAIEQENYYNENLLQAIQTGALKMYLQRQVLISDPFALRGKVLVRWALPNGRLIYPDSFIPQFQKNGMMVHLDFYIIEQAFQYLYDLRVKGERPVMLTISLASVTIFQPDFMKRFAALAEQYHVQPEYIGLELQDVELVASEAAVLENMEKLKGQGYTLVAQVLLSGCSNLGLLGDLPVQVLKIDRQFLRSAVGNEKIVTIMGAITRLAHDLSMQLLCEGVEHAQDVTLLRNLGCDIIQGYYLMRAIPKEEFLSTAQAGDATLQETLQQEIVPQTKA